MKKIFALSLLTFFASLTSFAYVYDNATSDNEVLKQQGYSKSTLELVDKMKYAQQGQGGNYKKIYNVQNKTKLSNPYFQIKTYFDPMQDDGKFGEHSIEFSNTVRGETTFYSSPLKEKTEVENL